MNAVEKFKAAKEIVRNAQAEASKIVKEAFSEMAKIVFTNNPELKGFRWTQYTPYFNDGESCEFSVHSDCPSLLHPKDEANGYEDEDEDESIGWIIDPGYWGKYKDLQTPLRKASEDVAEFLSQFNDSDFEEMFGDHVQITVTPEGVEVDEYSHD